MTFIHLLFLQKNSTTGVSEGPKYATALFVIVHKKMCIFSNNNNKIPEKPGEGLFDNNQLSL